MSARRLTRWLVIGLAIGTVLAGAPVAGAAAPSTPLVGFVSEGLPPGPSEVTFRQALTRLGWGPDRVTVVARWETGQSVEAFIDGLCNGRSRCW